MKDKVVKNEFGFHEVVEKPSREELKAYYTKKYYQEGKANTYSRNITDREKAYKYNKVEQRFHYLQEKRPDVFQRPCRLLDVGCGEGFALSFFKKMGWSATGLEFADYACSFFHPDCLDNLMVGDIQDNLSKLEAEGAFFDLIWLDNVLEHVIDPLSLLKQLRQLGRFLIVEVPNDFSQLQMTALDSGKIDNAFWVNLPDHLSYFNQAGLSNLGRHAGWSSLGTIADFPIDWFLFNDHANYIADRSTGKQAHYARVAIDTMMHEVSIPKLNRLYEALADLGMGRQIVAFFETPEVR